MITRTWLITGASRGLGHAFTRAALERGDAVFAVARDVTPLAALAERHGDRLTVHRADVSVREQVFDAVAAAVDRLGHLDVVVNNAGVLTMGMVEELSEAEARALMDVNFFGALWVGQAVLPHLRERRAGHIVQVSSIAALGGFPMTGIYSASKFALEGLSEALAAEAAHFGVTVSILQPGGYWTDLYTRMRQATPLAAYDGLRAEIQRQWSEGSADSDPKLAADALMTLVDSDEPPARLLLGSMIYDLAFDVSRRRMATWSDWEEVSRAAEHAVPAP